MCFLLNAEWDEHYKVDVSLSDKYNLMVCIT